MRVVLIHGTMGTPSGNWFPWLADQLASYDVQTVTPTMPTPEAQSLTNWHTSFRSQVGALDEETVLVGHSVGAVFAMRLLEHLAQPVMATALVCPFIDRLGLPDYDRLNASFLGSPFDWASIQRNAGAIRVFVGDNDPYIPLAQSTSVASSLRLDPTIITGGGHLNAESGFLAFPPLRDWILNSFKIRSL